MKNRIYIGVIISLNLLVMFATQVILIRYAGLNAEVDSFVAAQTVPSVIFAILSSAINGVWLARLTVKFRDKSELLKRLSSAHLQVSFFALVLILPLFLLTSHWIPIIFPGFDDQQLILTKNLSFFFLINLFFNMNALLGSIFFRVTGSYIFLEKVLLASSLFVFLAIWIFLPIFGLYAAALILLLKTAIILIIQLNASGLVSHHFLDRKLNLESLKDMKPLLLASGVNKTSILVDRFFASSASNGSITSLNLAQNIIGAVGMIFERLFCMTNTPKFARLVESFQIVELRNLYRKNIGWITLATFIFIVGLMLSKNIFVIFFSNTLNIEFQKTKELWLMCLSLVGFLYAGVVSVILTSVFYALKDFRTPVFIGISVYVIGVIIKAKLFSSFGLIGIPVATSIYSLITALVYLLALEFKFLKVNEN